MRRRPLRYDLADCQPELSRCYHVDERVGDAVDELEQDNEVTESLVEAGPGTTDGEEGDQPEGDVGHRHAHQDQT